MEELSYSCGHVEIVLCESHDEVDEEDVCSLCQAKISAAEAKVSAAKAAREFAKHSPND